MIKFENVCFKYPKFAMENLNFEIAKGEIVALVGNNASGKTTVLNLMAGLIKAKKGKVEIGENSKSGRVGIVFQNPDNQIIFSTVEADIQFTLKNHKIPKSEFDVRIDHALKLVGIEHLKKAETLSLSTGQKQKVVIANMLAVNPDVLILDESTVYLDPGAKDELYHLLLNLKSQGMTIVFATNEISELVFADKIMVLDNGKIKEFADRKDVLGDLSVFEALGMKIPLKLQLISKYKLFDLQFDDELFKYFSAKN